MKLVKKLIFFSLAAVVMMSFSQCASMQKLEVNSPVKFKEVYYKEWSNPARGMGSGLNLCLVLLQDINSVELDSVYFRKKQAKLVHTKNNTFIAKFETDKNKTHDIIMSADPKEEYGNTLPKVEKPIPYELNDNECVVSYKDGDKTKYFKISDINKKKSKSTLDHPM